MNVNLVAGCDVFLSGPIVTLKAMNQNDCGHMGL